jgi:C4-dicarboxylate-specific signal transduction histidine kinase
VSVRKIVGSTLELCTERFRNHQIELRVGEIPEIELVCREVQIAQILLNLLNNAFDAVLQEPEKWVALEIVVRPEAIEFSVTDGGAGIPESVRANMMNPFFTTKPVGQGTGLGLSISSGIAEEHAGSLRFDSTAPHTRFVLTLSRHLQT